MSYSTYDAEQQDRIRRIGPQMRRAAPITNRTVSAPKGSTMCKQIRGGTPAKSGARKSGY